MIRSFDLAITVLLSSTPFCIFVSVFQFCTFCFSTCRDSCSSSTSSSRGLHVPFFFLTLSMFCLPYWNKKSYVFCIYRKQERCCGIHGTRFPLGKRVERFFDVRSSGNRKSIYRCKYNLTITRIRNQYPVKCEVFNCKDTSYPYLDRLIISSSIKKKRCYYFYLCLYRFAKLMLLLVSVSRD